MIFGDVTCVNKTQVMSTSVLDGAGNVVWFGDAGNENEANCMMCMKVYGWHKDSIRMEAMKEVRHMRADVINFYSPDAGGDVSRDMDDRSRGDVCGRIKVFWSK